jgi:hypothetical protein
MLHHRKAISLGVLKYIKADNYFLSNLTKIFGFYYEKLSENDVSYYLFHSI